MSFVTSWPCSKYLIYFLGYRNEKQIQGVLLKIIYEDSWLIIAKLLAGLETMISSSFLSGYIEVPCNLNFCVHFRNKFTHRSWRSRAREIKILTSGIRCHSREGTITFQSSVKVYSMQMLFRKKFPLYMGGKETVH